MQLTFLIVSILLLALIHGGNALRLHMNSVAVFGGTGKTGSECVYQALKSGKKCIVLARDASKMTIPLGSGGSLGGQPLSDDNLTVIEGSVTDPTAVEKVFAAADDISGVIVALGGKTKDVGPTMLTDGTENIVTSMKRKGLKRIAVVTSIGAGDSENQAPFFFKVLMMTVMKGIFTDKNNQESIFLNGDGKDLEYCIVRPGGLGEGPPTGIINVIDGQAGSIQRADVAQFCLGAVLDESFEYLGKTPCISSVGGTSWKKEKGFSEVTKA